MVVQDKIINIPEVLTESFTNVEYFLGTLLSEHSIICKAIIVSNAEIELHKLNGRAKKLI